MCIGLKGDNMEFRKMNELEKDIVYKMGYEEWGSNQSLDKFYKENEEEERKGTRYVLLNDDGIVVSSLLLIETNPHHEHFSFPAYGIGSVVTEKKHRNQGYAKIMISNCLLHIKNVENNSIFFLYSDISPSYYRKLGFKELNDKQQRYKNSVCMVHCNPVQYTQISLMAKENIPTYF